MHKQSNRGFSKHSDTKSGFLFTEIIFQTLVIDANCVLGLEQLHFLQFTFWNPSVGFFAQELVSERNSVQSSSKQSVLRWNIRANRAQSFYFYILPVCMWNSSDWSHRSVVLHVTSTEQKVLWTWIEGKTALFAEK